MSGLAEVIDLSEASQKKLINEVSFAGKNNLFDMKKIIKNHSSKLAAAVFFGVAAQSVSAYEVHPMGTNMPAVDFHGFASQGFLASSDYNYLGNDTKNGSFNFTEAGLNASINPFPRTRITAQAFTFDLGNDVGQYDVVLDYAQAEYTFNDYLGVRGGRIRRPQGIYNAVQDVDMARTFVLLPQGVYDSRWRDFYVSLDGGEFFGTLPLGKAGSLSYELYGGLDNCAENGGVAKFIGFLTGLRPVSINQEPHSGVQLWWNTPVDGLRLGANGGYKFDFEFKQAVGPFSATGYKEDISYFQGSIEYCWKKWTFQTEYYTYLLHPLPETAAIVGPGTRGDAWYVAASYRFNKWVETGVYYSEWYTDVEHRGDSAQYQKDAALSLRFDLRDWWVFKVEGHYIHGTGLLEDNGANPSQDNRGWFMLALKTTLSF